MEKQLFNSISPLSTKFLLIDVNKKNSDEDEEGKLRISRVKNFLLPIVKKRVVKLNILLLVMIGNREDAFDS